MDGGAPRETAPRSRPATNPRRPDGDVTGILIPCHNEAGRVEQVVAEVLALGESMLGANRVVVIDDGSSDDTAARARQAGATVIRHRTNLGYGAALHTGYVYARNTGCNRVVQLDGDGQHDPRGIPILLAMLQEGADVALGSRYLDGEAPPTGWARRLGSRFFSWVASRWTGTRITDPTSGFQALSARALREVAHDGFPDDYPDADVLIQLCRAGLRLREVPVQMHPRLGGRSMHCGKKAFYYGYKMGLTLLLLRWRRATPFHHPDHVGSGAGPSNQNIDP